MRRGYAQRVTEAADIRALGVNDVDALRGMLTRCSVARFQDLPTYTSRQPDDAYLHELLGREHSVGHRRVHQGSMW